MMSQRSYDYEALWLKGKLFINRAMDEEPISFDEQALWASLALELLGKSALAKISPLLIAEPTEEGKNILAALGIGEGDGKFTTVSASTVFKRCKRAFQTFDLDHANDIASARNEYLHGAGIGFGAISADKWWQRFWSVTSTLLDAQDKTIEELVGCERSDLVAKYLEQNKQYTAQRLQSLIDRAKQRYAQKLRGDLPEKLQKAWQSEMQLAAGLTHSDVATCPACGNLGRIEAEDVQNERSDGYFDYATGESDSWGVADALPDYFSCAACQLVLSEYSLLEEAGLDEPFEVQGDEFREEPQYGND
ncbi:hypothetical protein ASH00_14635 [Arthrobacter sp. Soil782]|uniref:hypothetical protein n=1 Tax=Arthrobacter sp. Soil782 TaxID=1736410 RepID=UPI0006FCB826|nr:hypothetical protein [Arthrobacter sp. Soil782]KRF04337.1 hypothetical protein ASH00_14635 [Arthrobacter sp. Soil782]